MSRPSPHTVAVQALRLRAWAMRILIAGDAPVPPPPASAAAWVFFAEMEWCSQPLRACLCDAGLWEQCDDTARRELGTAADAELHRISSARFEMAQAAEHARQAGWKVAVLKGGVAVACGSDVHLADVDLLVAPAERAPLVAALGGGGLTGQSSAREHLFESRMSGGAEVEVHSALGLLGDTAAVLERAAPLPTAPGLWQLAAGEHLWHVLHHATVKHSDRMGRLRDLVLIRGAVALCSDMERADVVRKAERDPARARLLGVLHLAATGESPPCVERGVRQRYFLLARWRGLAQVPMLRADARQLLRVASLLTVPGRLRLLAAELLAPTDVPCRSRLLNGLGTHLPATARALRVSARTPGVTAAALMAWSAAVESRIPRAPHLAG